MVATQSGADSATLARMGTLASIISACILSGCALWDAAGDSPDEPSDTPADVVTLDSVDETDSIEDIADDSESEDAQTGDASGDTSGDGYGCSQVNLNHLFDDFSAGEMTTQFQARTAFDGEGVWVVYVGSTGLSLSDATRNIYVTRLFCDGRTAFGPAVVNQEPLSADLPEPSIDIKGETVYLTWLEHSPTHPDKLAVWFRTLSLEGTWLMATDSAVKFQVGSDGPIDGGRLTQKFYRQDIAALNDATAMIAAAAQVGDRRQILVQKVSRDGSTIDIAMPVLDAEDFDFSYPRVIAESPDKIWISAQKVPSSAGSGQTLYPFVYRSFNLEDPTAEVEVRETPKVSPQFRHLPWATSMREAEDLFFAYVAVQGNASEVRIGEVTGQVVPTTVSDTPNRNDFPSLTASEQGGAASWFRWGGADLFTLSVHARAFERNGNVYTLGEQKLVAEFQTEGETGDAGAPSIVYVGGNRYFVAWTERSGLLGSTLKARFIEL